MSSQTFKSTVPLSLLDQLLAEGCSREKTYYIYDLNSYKRLQCKELILPFIEKITPHYHVSKRSYVTRPMNSKRLLTIIRQICRQHNIPYVSNLHYSHSKYDIVYNIYLPVLQGTCN